MRLIDADALIEAMKKTESEYENAMTCPSWWSAFNVISEQPTAYDIDKVVTELNELEAKVITRYKNGDFGDFDGVDYYIKKSKAIEIVKQEAEKFGTDINVGSNGWIPCSERLPEKYGDYLVAWKPLHMSAKDIIKKVGRAVPHFYEIVEYDPDNEALWIGSIEQAQGEYEIIAWQPLPLPYKEE